MKRLLVLIVMLLLVGAAQAEAPDPRAALEAVYPDAKVIASAQDEDDAFFLLEISNGASYKLCGFALQDGVWTMTLDSDKAIRSSGLSDDFYRWIYDALSLSLTEDTLSICYAGWTKWQYDFTKDENGAWRFIRLYVTDEANLRYNELTYADGCVSQTYIDEYRDGTQEVSYTPPCPMPWLVGCETLAGFDASAFPMNLSYLLRAELARVAAELLPEHTFIDGKFSTYAATFLMDNPAGERVFIGGVYEDDAWVWTESTPLPADAWCDSFHAGAGGMSIGYDHPDSEPDEWGDYPYVEYVIYLQEDGRWMVESILDYFDDWLHFEADGLYINITGTVYGQSTLERDITKIDWVSYPLTLEDVLPTMSDDWGVIREPSLPLYADPDESVLLAEYLYATPVHVLGYEEDDSDKGGEGYLAQVQIADSDVVGWMPAYGLFLGAEQLWEYTEIWEGKEWSCYVTAEGALAMNGEILPGGTLPTGTHMYVAPEGEIIWTTDEEYWQCIMADYGNGWYHVRYAESTASCFVREEDCLLD